MNKAVIGIDKSGSFQVYFAISAGLVEDARNIQNHSHRYCGFGRVLTGAALMGLMMKNPKDKLTVQFKGDGPAGDPCPADGTEKVRDIFLIPKPICPREDGKLDVRRYRRKAVLSR